MKIKDNTKNYAGSIWDLVWNLAILALVVILLGLLYKRGKLDGFLPDQYDSTTVFPVPGARIPHELKTTPDDVPEEQAVPAEEVVVMPEESHAHSENTQTTEGTPPTEAETTTEVAPTPEAAPTPESTEVSQETPAAEATPVQETPAAQ